MATQREIDFISPEQYLEIQRTAEFRSEYISGEMFALAAPSRAHGDILMNLAGVLREQLRRAGCQGNVGASVAAPSSFLIPDLVVYCNGGEFSGQGDILLNPTAIFEVLSPSTSDFDHGHKWILYQSIPSLMHYVMISQDEARLETFSREADGGWHYASATGLDCSVALSYVGCQMALAAIYEGVSLFSS